MPILGSCNSAANKDMISKIWTNGDAIISVNRKHEEKREIAPFEKEKLLLFPQCFQKLFVVDASK